ncbi:MAG: co-chaperone GroES family protein [Burkholderiales bacterium]
MESKRKLTALEERWQQDKGVERKGLEQVFTDDGKVDAEKLEASVLDLIPQPTGWRLAILPYRGAKTSKGGIVLADETQKRNQLATNVGYVLKMGNLAYADESKFPHGPWCKQGDWVVFGRYAGSRIQIEGGEIRLLNDDEILGVISDPENILHM